MQNNAVPPQGGLTTDGQKVDPELKSPDVINIALTGMNNVAERSPSYHFVKGISSLVRGRDG